MSFLSTKLTLPFYAPETWPPPTPPELDGGETVASELSEAGPAHLCLASGRRCQGPGVPRYLGECFDSYSEGPFHLFPLSTLPRDSHAFFLCLFCCCLMPLHAHVQNFPQQPTVRPSGHCHLGVNIFSCLYLVTTPSSPCVP